MQTIPPCCALLACLLASASTTTVAETGKYPVKPVRILVPFAAGGGTDLLARLVAQKVGAKLGHTLVVDNRPGAGGLIAAEIAAKSAPDGYTIMAVSGTLAGTVNLHRKLTFDLVKDFAAITQATTQPYVMIVHPGLPVKSLKDFIALTKAKPGSLNYGSSGAGSMQHLTGVRFASMAGLSLAHIPYKGGALALNDVIAGQIQLGFINYVVSGPHIKAGRVRALAVTTAKRSPAIPDLPAIAEFVPGYESDNWYGFAAPAKAPAVIVELLHREIAAALLAPDVREKLAVEASQVVASAPKAFAAHIKSEVETWRKVILDAGIKPE